MRSFSRLLAIVVALAAVALAADKPNFVFFLVDDLGWRDVGSFGSAFYETPNIDRLASTGVRFTDAYAACPVCSPTRASIMTGRYPVRSGITTYINPEGRNQPQSWTRNTLLLPAPYSDRLAHDEVTIAEVLKEAGYATFFAGKWHLGPEDFWPEDQGFDVNKGGIERGGPYGGNRYFSPYGNPRLDDGPPGEHLPARLGKETATFIEEHRDGPFLAYLAFYSVHTPLMTREDLRQKYAERARKQLYLFDRFLPEGTREARQVQDHAVYAGMVESMDLAVGTVLDTLDRLKLAEDTVVIFMSDNGGLSTSEGSPTSNLPLRGGKGWMYEGGIREPMIIRAPGVSEPGTSTGQPVTSTDFFPTILELAGLDHRPDLHQDGVSLVPVLRGERLASRALYWHFPHYGNQGATPAGAIREGDWKLIEWYEEGQLQLFNLASDIGERYDLKGRYPERALRMQQKLADWRRSTGAVMPADNPKFDRASRRYP